MAEIADHRAAAVLAAASGRVDVRVGNRVQAEVHRLVTDGPGALAVIDSWRRYGRGRTPRRVDHALFVDGGRLPRKDRPRVLRFCAEHHPALGLDPILAGAPATVAVEEGHVGSDDVVAGFHPDLGALGGLGAVVLRVAPDELAELLDRRTLDTVIPDVVRVAVTGRLPRWVGPFDLARHLIDAAGGVQGLRGRALELHGDTITGLPVELRMSLCAALAHAGLAALVSPDEATRVFLAGRLARDDDSRAESALPAGEPRAPDLELDARKVRLAALDGETPLDPTAEDGPEVQQVILTGRLADLRAAAEAMAERPLAPGLHLVVIPASRRVLLHAMESGLATNLVRQGASLLPPGSAPPPAPRGEVRITTEPTGGRDLLVGPALAGASALAGRLMDPDAMRRAHKRSASIR